MTAYINPLDDLLQKTNNNPKEIQQAYHLHRTSRNEKQKAHLLSPDFKAFSLDTILAQQLADPNYEDPRNCFVLWARPTAKVRELAAEIQKRLSAGFPNLWLMPPSDMHITLAEVTHSKPASEIEALVSRVSESLPEITNYTTTHSTSLNSPSLGFDAQAIALTYLPSISSPYTYHHLRRDIYKLCDEAGIQVQARYVHLSAHLTIARFVNESDLKNEKGELDGEKVKKLVGVLEGINEWLEGRWEGSDWTVGDEVGIVARKGRLWYGGGESICEGKGL